MSKERKGTLVLNNTGGSYSPKGNELKTFREEYFFGGDYTQSVTGDKADAVAQKEDFIPFVFRHLSATVVGAGTWKATDFSDEKVLKKGMKLLQHKPVYINHNLKTNNIVGVNGKVKWVEKRTGKDGKEIPAGIEAPIWIDGKLHQDLTRKLTAFPVPHIQSVSVTVDFSWIPSHEFKDRNGNDDEWEFERQIGLVVDGKMVRRVVTKITAFYETSLVWLGADPFAKIINKEGEPLNIERSGVIDKKEFDQDPYCSVYKNCGKYFIEDKFAAEKKTLSYSKGNNHKDENSENMNSEELKALKTKLGLTAEQDITADVLANFEIVAKKDYSELNNKVANLEKEKGSLESKITALNSDNEILKPFKTQIEDFKEKIKDTNISMDNLVEFALESNKNLNDAREECIKSYKATLGKEESAESVINMINAADLSTVNGLMQSYGKTAFEKFGATCSACGSKEIKFGTVKREENNEDNGESIPHLADIS